MRRGARAGMWIAVIVAAFVLASFPGVLIARVLPLGRQTAIAYSALRILGHAVLATVIGSSLYHETRRIRTGGWSRQGGVRLFCSVGPACLMLAVTVIGFGDISPFGTYLDAQFQDLRSQLSDRIRTETSPARKALLTRLHAQATYELEGTLLAYQTPEGTAITYTPTAEAEANRGLFLFWETQRRWGLPVRVGMSGLWFAAIAVPILFAMRGSS